ncbi:MAG: hypothetical protein U0746_02980 [Gemmataceae bacterium]
MRSVFKWLLAFSLPALLLVLSGGCRSKTPQVVPVQSEGEAIAPLPTMYEGTEEFDPNSIRDAKLRLARMAQVEVADVEKQLVPIMDALDKAVKRIDTLDERFFKDPSEVEMSVARLRQAIKALLVMADEILTRFGDFNAVSLAYINSIVKAERSYPDAADYFVKKAPSYTSVASRENCIAVAETLLNLLPVLRDRRREVEVHLAQMIAIVRDVREHRELLSDLDNALALFPNGDLSRSREIYRTRVELYLKTFARFQGAFNEFVTRVNKKANSIRRGEAATGGPPSEADDAAYRSGLAERIKLAEAAIKTSRETLPATPAAAGSVAALTDEATDPKYDTPRMAFWSAHGRWLVVAQKMEYSLNQYFFAITGIQPVKDVSVVHADSGVEVGEYYQVMADSTRPVIPTSDPDNLFAKVMKRLPDGTFVVERRSKVPFHDREALLVRQWALTSKKFGTTEEVPPARRLTINDMPSTDGIWNGYAIAGTAKGIQLRGEPQDRRGLDDEGTQIRKKYQPKPKN